MARESICAKTTWLLAALVCAAGVWIYTQRVLIPYQISDSAARGRPRGNLSDLYPRWLGARELLLHGRDPYSPEISREIQAGYYGRLLDPERPSDPKDQQGFVYPLYVVLYLAPTIHAPFPAVQRFFFWILFAFTVASVPVWLRVLRWPLLPSAQLSVIVLTLGSLGVMQALKLQQLTLLVVPLVALAMLLLIKDHQVIAGIVMALATVKPQLLWLILLCLVIWTVGDWRRRWRWLASFAVTLAALMIVSELLLPHWIPKFLHALSDYRMYTATTSVEDVIPRPWSWLLALIALAATLHAAWKSRCSASGSDQFARMMSAALAVTVLVLPALAPYNQVLLLPAILLAIRERDLIWGQGFALRAMFVVTVLLLAWPWVVTTMLAALSYLVPPLLLQKYWAVPFWTSLAIPMDVGALLLVYTHRTPVRASGRRMTA